ncbi:PIN domain-containing protein [Pyrobaculum ferrireducens]|uniref:PilT protein domain protein n=1 Tax=Pyrobaculum ferrireducens TaxID=1104324 RepID=G7VI26_9CREN|nr:PIN domain-containing protein [Pyrobaculum ferrireducens]AET33386.1 PilT protein domain protein [Pyrobaculum ferrireducens]
MKRVLLDTSFIPPILGVEVEGAAPVLKRLDVLSRRGEVGLYYSDFSILEALWKIAKTNFDIKRVEMGLRSIELGLRKAYADRRVFLKALELRGRGHRDVVDLLLYATAARNHLLFLTMDRDLINFLENAGEDISIVVNTL